MGKLNEYRRAYVREVADRLDDAFDILVHCMHDIENCGCKAQEKKLDNIVGKLENVMHELYEKAKP